MLILDFAGWFECRLATDSDPSDDRRGVTGFTRAMPGELDLDRVIRFQPDPARPPRQPGPPPEAQGVKVHTAKIDGTIDVPALKDAKVELLPGRVGGAMREPKFEGRNGLAFDDEREPIFPFHIRISGTDIVLEREHRDEVSGDWHVTGPIRTRSVDLEEELFFIATGQSGPAAFETFLKKRRKELGAAIKMAPAKSLDALALRTRRAHLKRTEPIARFFLPVVMTYRLILNWPLVRVEDPKTALPREVDSAPWTCRLVLGVWDADALCGFAQGQLIIPLR